MRSREHHSRLLMVIIRDRATLATLCIFYEQVRLPWMPPEAVQSFTRVRKTIGTDGKTHVDVDQSNGKILANSNSTGIENMNSSLMLACLND
jgi:hypothetical protein